MAPPGHFPDRALEGRRGASHARPRGQRHARRPLDRSAARRPLPDRPPDRARRHGRGLRGRRPPARPGRARSRRCTAASPTTPRSPTGSSARPAPPPGSPTRTWSTSSTRARTPTVEGGTLYLVMELVPGHTLRDVIRAEAPMPPARALALLEPVVSALAAAHRAGVVHRDIKPENVLIADDGRRQGRRLRAGQGRQRRHPAHRDRRRPHRHGLLPGARARRRRHQRRPRRRVRRRRGALRDAHRRQAPRGRVADRGRLQARPRGRAAAVPRRARHPAVRRRAGRARHRPRPCPAPGRRGRPAPPAPPRRPGRSPAASATTRS